MIQYNNHAVLSASSSHRWLHCTPSARLELEFDSKTSEAAAEGSAAHALAEHKLKRALKMRSQRPTLPYEDDKQDGVVNNTFVQLIEALGYDIELTYVKREVYNVANGSETV